MAKEFMSMEEYYADLVGGAKATPMKKKGMAKGGKMTTKGYAKGGAAGGMRKPSNKNSGLYGRR